MPDSTRSTRTRLSLAVQVSQPTSTDCGSRRLESGVSQETRCGRRPCNLEAHAAPPDVAQTDAVVLHRGTASARTRALSSSSSPRSVTTCTRRPSNCSRSATRPPGNQRWAADPRQPTDRRRCPVRHHRPPSSRTRARRSRHAVGRRSESVRACSGRDLPCGAGSFGSPHQCSVELHLSPAAVDAASRLLGSRRDGLRCSAACRVLETFWRRGGVSGGKPNG